MNDSVQDRSTSIRAELRNRLAHYAASAGRVPGEPSHLALEGLASERALAPRVPLGALAAPALRAPLGRVPAATNLAPQRDEEPATLSLLVLGATGVIDWRRKREALARV